MWLQGRRAWGDALIPLLILTAAFVHPPHGLGVTLCPSRALTDIPCPGCGLSRSISCAVRGMWSESFGYHPFGIVVVAICVATLLYGWLGPKVGGLMRPRPRRIARIFWALFGTVFVMYGLVRAGEAYLRLKAARPVPPPIPVDFYPAYES